METIIVQKLQTLRVVANNYTVREETLDGKKHLVVPVVMMVEGVHSGSAGPILHTAAELAKWTEAWDGIPVTISHPEAEGTNVSANSPEVLDASSVGRIFNTVYDDGLKAEAWIDYEKISAKSTEALYAIEAMEPLEVSIGVFTDSEDTEGEWKGETYDSIAYNYRPDHLALLPGDEGACSWNDGCGIRANQKGGIVKDLVKTFQELSQKGYVVSLISNEMGYREIQEVLSAKLRDLNTEGVYHYVEDVFDNYIVYSKWADSGGETLYKQGYTMDDNNNITFDGGASEVRKNVEYVTNKMRRAKPVNNNNKGGKMRTNENVCCEAKVDELIANKQTHWMPKDREWLLTQDEATIAKMSPMEPGKVEQSTEEIQANKDQVIADYNAGKKTTDDYTKDMPEAMKAEVEGGVKLYKEHRETLVKGIMDNTTDVWEKDALNAMDDKTLENVSKSIKQPADYSGQAAGGAQATNGEQVEIPVEYASTGKEDK